MSIKLDPNVNPEGALSLIPWHTGMPEASGEYLVLARLSPPHNDHVYVTSLTFSKKYELWNCTDDTEEDQPSRSDKYPWDIAGWTKLENVVRFNYPA